MAHEHTLDLRKTDGAGTCLGEQFGGEFFMSGLLIKEIIDRSRI
jgi:hypothetical protein